MRASKALALLGIGSVLILTVIIPAKAASVTLDLSSPPAFSDRIAFSIAGQNTTFPANDIVVGYGFTPESDITVTHLGMWAFQGNLIEQHEIGIFKASNRQLIASTFVGPADPLDQGFRYAAITPVTLEFLVDYVIAVHIPAGGDPYFPNPPLNPTQGIQRGNAFQELGAFQFPTQSLANHPAGPNFKFQAETVTSLNDRAGRARFVGGEVRMGGNLIGYYDWHSRQITGRGAAVLGNETVGITLTFIGPGVPRSITLQGVYRQTTAQGKGGVSAVSSGLPSSLETGKWSCTGAPDQGTLVLDF